MNQENSLPSQAAATVAPLPQSIIATTSATTAADESSAPAPLSASFHLRQAEALRCFLRPRQTLPEEAAVANSPDLSSASEEDEAQLDEQRSRGAHLDTTNRGLRSPLTPAWRPHRSTVSCPLTPLPHHPPSVHLGGALESIAIRQNSGVLHFEAIASASTQGGSGTRTKVFSSGEESLNDDAQTRLQGTESPSGFGQEHRQYTNTEMESPSARYLLPPSHTFLDESHKLRLAGNHSSAMESMDKHNDKDERESREDASLSAQAASSVTGAAAPSLHCWQPTRDATAAAAAAAAARVADFCTPAHKPACKQTDTAHDHLARHTPETLPSSLAPPLSSASPADSATAAEAGDKGIPALVVWRAASTPTGGEEGALSDLSPPHSDFHCTHPSLAAKRGRLTRSLLLLSPCSQQRRMERGNPLPMAATHASLSHRKERRLFAPLFRAQHTCDDCGGGSQRAAVHAGRDSSSSSSSEDESEDIFDDGGGSSSGCLFNACVVCLSCVSGLISWCCSRSWRRCRRLCGCCRAGGRHLNATAVEESAEHPSRTTGSEHEVGGEDHRYSSENDAQLRRPLLSPARPEQPTHSRDARGDSASLAGERTSAAQLQQHFASSPRTQPLHTQAARAAQSLRFSDEEDSDDASTGGSAAANGKSGGGRNAHEPFSASGCSFQRHPSAAPPPNAIDVFAGRDGRADRPVALPLLRRLGRRLSRYSLYNVFAYLNVFSAVASEYEGGMSVAAAQDDAVHARSPFVLMNALVSTQAGSRAAVLHAPQDTRGGRGGHTSATSLSSPPPSAATTAASPCSARAMGQRGVFTAVPAAGQVYVLLHYAAFALLTATVGMLAVFEFRHDLVAEVKDATACNRFTYRDLVRPDFSFSLICFVLNSVLATHYAVRAVRYEKGGLLVVQVVIVALQVCRAVYFLLFVAARYLCRFEDVVAPPDRTERYAVGLAALSSPSSPQDAPPPPLVPLLILTWAGVVSSVALFLVAAASVAWVYASFGWRQYAQGIVNVGVARVRQRLTTLQTCVQLDSVVTVNAYLASVFLLDTWQDQGVLLAVSGVVLLLHAVLVPALRRTRHWWPLLCAGCVLLTVSGYFAALIGDSLQRDYHLRAMSSSPWYSACYTEQLPGCLDSSVTRYPISLYRDGCGVDQRAGGVLPSANREASCSAKRPRPASLLTDSLHLPVLAKRRSFALHDVDNTTDTFIPTLSAYPDYFHIRGCNETCFANEEKELQQIFTRSIARCCGDYGQCRLKDAYRTYAVILLTILTALAYGVRVVLLAVAWRRYIDGDDDAIEGFLQDKRERRRRRRPLSRLPLPSRRAHDGAAQYSDGGGGRERDRARLLSPAPSIPPRTRSPQPDASPVARQSHPFIWNVGQYNRLRYEADAAGLMGCLGGCGATPRCDMSNPLSL